MSGQVTPNAAKLIAIMEEFDDGNTGFIPTPIMQVMLQECGDKLKDNEWKDLINDMDQDGKCAYKWYVENILCNSEGVGHYKHWLKQ